MILLQAKDVSFRYGSRYALKDLNFSLDCGKKIGLLGPNGSGKTTLLKIIAGLLQPSNGEIRIGDAPVGVITKRHVSFLPDTNYLPKFQTIRGLLNFFETFYQDFEKEKAEEMIQRLNLNQSSSLSSLSKGNSEKIQLIMAMSRHANLYCLDEPIAGVDPAAREYIMNTILNHCEPDSTLFISTHLIADIENILDEVIFLKDHTIYLHSSIEELREEHQMSVDELFREVYRC